MTCRYVQRLRTLLNSFSLAANFLIISWAVISFGGSVARSPSSAAASEVRTMPARMRDVAISRFFMVVNRDAVQDTSKLAIAEAHFCAAFPEASSQPTWPDLGERSKSEGPTTVFGCNMTLVP